VGVSEESAATPVAGKKNKMNPHYSRFDLTGRTALVTGSAQGLGLAIARGLGEAGAAVILNGRDRARLVGAAETLQNAGLKVTTASFDVTKPDEIARELAVMEKDFGPIDILVNNAGIQRRVALEKMEVKVWQELLETNLTSAFLVARVVAPGMIARKSGKIINICSLMSDLARPTTGGYAAAKGGLKMLTRAMAAEWAKHNLQINGLGPGYFATELTRPLVEDTAFNQWICNRTPAARWGQPEELVGAAVFLASAASNFINGQILYVDGGLSAAI